MNGAAVGAASAEVLGRDHELARADAMLERARSALSALVIDGDPGMGKTAVWQHVTRRATSAGLTLLWSRPSGADTTAPFGCLRDLFASVDDGALARLPGPQRQALASALLRDDPRSTQPTDAQVIAAATTSLLDRLAADGPLLLAIDDLQWLDPTSERALGTALRRLVDRPIGVLLARRPGDSAIPFDLARAAPGGSIETHRLGPLAMGHLQALIRARLGWVPARPVLVRVVEASGGNPLHALELARAWTSSDTGIAQPLPLPPSLREIMVRRLAPTSTSERELLLLIAAGGSIREGELRRRASTARALDDAEKRQLVDIDHGTVRLAHPLLASAVYGAATTGDRRRAHARLAELAVDPVDAARHRASAVTGPDEAVARELDEAAVEADRRGAPEVAADLMSLALDLGDDHPPNRARRLLHAARYRFRAGDTPAAISAASSVCTDTDPDIVVDARLLLAEIEFEAGSAATAVLHCTEGLRRVPTDDAARRARLHATLALVDYTDFERSVVHARRARDLIDRLDQPDPHVESLTLFALVANELLLGRGFRRTDARRAVELEQQARAPRVADRASAALGVWLTWIDELDEARTVLEDALDQAAAEGDESSVPYVLSHLSNLELRAGNWARARSHALEVLDRAEAVGQDFQRAQGTFLVATVDAHLGDIDTAEHLLTDVLTTADSWSDRWLTRGVRSTLGFCALSRGDLTTARSHLTHADDISRELNIGDPGSRRSAFQLAEVLIGLGEIESATALIDDLHEAAVRLDRPSALAGVARLRSLRHGANGDVDEADETLSEAFGQLDRVSLPFDVAQCWLTRGRLERRRRRRGAARAALEEALRRFDALGARAWATITREELARLGLRQDATNTLTTGERHVAELAASGLTNREVAAKLFISSKTVEANLSRAYRKLGIRSRAELGRVMHETTTR